MPSDVLRLSFPEHKILMKISEYFPMKSHILLAQHFCHGPVVELPDTYMEIQTHFRRDLPNLYPLIKTYNIGAYLLKYAVRVYPEVDENSSIVIRAKPARSAEKISMRTLLRLPIHELRQKADQYKIPLTMSRRRIALCLFEQMGMKNFSPFLEEYPYCLTMLMDFDILDCLDHQYQLDTAYKLTPDITGTFLTLLAGLENEHDKIPIRSSLKNTRRGSIGSPGKKTFER